MSELLKFWIYQKHSDGTKTLVSAEPVLASSHNNALWRYYEQAVQGRSWQDFKSMGFDATMVAPKQEEIDALANSADDEEEEPWWNSDDH